MSARLLLSATTAVARRVAIIVLCAAGLCAGGSGARAQGVTPPPIPTLDIPANTGATGSVTGRVICADTQRPARFAEVQLIAVQQPGDDDDNRFGNRGARATGRTDLDGSYTIQNVQPGDYYLSATATGYVSNAATAFERASSNTSDTASLLRQLPQVHVAAGGAAQGSVQLERGGVIAGRLLWDDGSPAAGVTVNAVNTATTNSLTRRGPNPLAQLGFNQGSLGGFGQTDDRGNFRMTGLPANSYLVRATFVAPAPAASVAFSPGFRGPTQFAITLYAPGKVRRGDAVTVTLAPGEERDDVVFTADLRSLHSVTGRVSSASDAAVHSGSVQMVDSQDSTLTRTARLNTDGSFTVPYVPAGSYTLTANASSAQQGNAGGRRGGSTSTTAPATAFQPLQETLTVTDADVTGLNLTVVPQTASAAGSQ